LCLSIDSIAVADGNGHNVELFRGFQGGTDKGSFLGLLPWTSLGHWWIELWLSFKNKTYYDCRDQLLK
jgi:hypothetical protein